MSEQAQEICDALTPEERRILSGGPKSWSDWDAAKESLQTKGLSGPVYEEGPWTLSDLTPLGLAVATIIEDERLERAKLVARLQEFDEDIPF